MSATYDEQLAELKAFGRTLSEVPVPGTQGSAEWHRQRIGRATASRFTDAINFRLDKKESAKRYNYRMELVIERLTNEPSEHYVSEYMEWGSEHEAAARMAYEAATGSMALVPGFIPHPSIPMCGGSPDALVDEDGLIEIKAPASTTHIETLLFEECDYLPQIQGNLACTGRKWADFVSYDPRMPAPLQLYIRRFQRDEQYIAKLEADVRAFLGGVDEVMDKLHAIGARAKSTYKAPVAAL